MYLPYRHKDLGLYAQHPCAKRSKGKWGLLVSQSSQSGSTGFKNTLSQNTEWLGKIFDISLWSPQYVHSCAFIYIHTRTTVKTKNKKWKNRVNKIAQQLKGARCLTMTWVQPWNPHDWRRKPILTNCPLTSTCIHGTCAFTHTQTHN